MSLQDHVTCAEDIYIVSRQLLCSDFLNKKYNKMGQKYEPRTKEDKVIYENQVCYGLPVLSGTEFFPCSFQSDMEDLMCHHHEDDPKCSLSNYYSVKDRIDLEQVKQDMDLLSDEPTLTQKDKEIIMAYNRKYYALMTYCLEHLEGFITNKRKKEYVKWMARIRKYAFNDNKKE